MYHFIFKNEIDFSEDSKLEKAMFGMGCFWGAEKKFWELEGVKLTAVGYAGGVSRSPSYRDVCTGLTGHNEVVKLQFDPTEISYAQLLATFWENRDPTQTNRQGNDIGTQYRSIILVNEKNDFEESKKYLVNIQKKFFDFQLGNIATEIKILDHFYYAEDYHQQYLIKNPNGYCNLKNLNINLD